MGQHVLPGGDQFGDDAGGHLRPGHLDGRFDHRQHEALDAEPVVPEIAPLGGQQAVVQVVGLGVVRQKAGESLLREAEEPLVLPKRVVGVEAEGGQRCAHSGGFRPFRSPTGANRSNRPFSHDPKALYDGAIPKPDSKEPSR